VLKEAISPADVGTTDGFVESLDDRQRTYLRLFRERFTRDEVIARVRSLETTRVLVIGEAIIDEYHYCMPDAMSNKSPTLSARFESAEVFAGGVVAVGNHVRGLCQHVSIVAGTGEDDGGDIDRFVSEGISLHRVGRRGAPTVRKRRFVHRDANQKLFEVTFLDDRPVTGADEDALIDEIERRAAGADLVIALDFGHGMFTPKVAEALRERSKYLAVNAQINSSNRGFNSIRKYREADYLSVDEYEIRLPFGDRYGPLETLIRRLGRETGCRRINVTLGDRGTLFYDGTEFHHAPVFTTRVVDTIGAGDALLAATALMVHSGSPSEMVPFIGNCMGGLMSQIVGHRRPVTKGELCRFVESLLV
jgi:bifunctional ADP-heptose synthase (sugar kinase/adenylyltransferase)